MYVHRGDTYPWGLTAFPTKAGGECPKATGENGQGSPCLSFKGAALYKTLVEVSKIGTTVSPAGSFWSGKTKFPGDCGYYKSLWRNSALSRAPWQSKI